MSELRQRRGDAAEGVAAPEGRWQEERSKEELQQEAEQLMAKLKEGPKPGTSHEAKKWKDELREDPYNLALIFQLGLAYAQDLQWDKAANVMLRGWKRVSEFEEQEIRVHFLMTLCQASMSTQKFRQALAVFNDIEEPENEQLAKRYEALKCYVLCSNGDASAGLKAFHRAIEGQDFDLCVGTWALCFPGLQKVGALEVTRSTLEALAADEAGRKKLQLVELIRNLKESTSKEQEQAVQTKSFMVKFFMAFFLIVLCIMGYFLHGMEAKNLASLKIKM